MTRQRQALRLDEWPARDRLAWERALRPADFLQPAGVAAHWADSYRIQVIKGYGKWLGFLVIQGWLDPDLPPAARVTPARIDTYVQWMENNDVKSMAIASRVSDLLCAMRSMAPDADTTDLRRAVRTLRARAKPTRDKHKRILPPDQILEAALDYLDALPELPCDNDVIRASWYRDALALAILACRPIRRKNLTALTLGGNLVRVGGVWQCRFDAAETKEKRPLAFALPAILDPHIETYLALHRPRLLRGNASDRLWISTRGGPASAQTLYKGICQMTTKLLGRPINPHLLRDCVASAMIDRAPEHVLGAGRILGHASIQTTMAHYDQSLMRTAAELYHQTLAALKQQGA